MQPRDWCYPPEVFGKITLRHRGDRVAARTWNPPRLSANHAPSQWAEFRAAIIQHAYVIHLRSHKNSQSPVVRREDLGRLDTRPDSFSKWTARMNGTAWWNLDDTAVVLQLFPRALPEWPEVQVFLDVATGVRQPPKNWGSNLYDVDGKPLSHPDLPGRPQRQ